MQNLSDENIVAKIAVKDVLHIMPAKRVKLSQALKTKPILKIILTIILFVKILEKQDIFVKNAVNSVVTKMMNTHVKMQEKNVYNAQNLYVEYAEMSALYVKRKMENIVKVAC